LARSHLILPLLLLSIGCSKLFAKDPAPADEASADAPEKGSQGHEETTIEKQEPASPGSYSVPFAYEISPEEPLAKARAYVAEVLRTNDVFMAQGKDHFKPFAEAEHPRATVLTCADSRVQSAAWDASPEDDSYTVRNLGNQVSTSVGSIEYGVERLHTPVLLIIGHTGCAAVEAAREKSKEKPEGALAEELSHISLPKDEEGTLAEAVAANVNAQVADAVGRFARHVQSGDLTVVGAVYDFRNDLDDGHGRLRLINVNGNIEEARIDAFEQAVKEGKGVEPAPPPGVKRTSSVASNFAPGALPTDATSDARVRALIEKASRLLPESRATINAVTVLGGGGLDALETGVLKTTGGRPPTPPSAAAGQHGAEHGAAEHGESPPRAPGGHGKASEEHDEPAAHAAPAKTPPAKAEHDAPAKGDHGAPAKAAPAKPEHAEPRPKPDAHGPAKPEHDPPPGKAAHEPPATGQPGGTNSGSAPPLPGKPAIKPPKEEHKANEH
jgi:carbonic anhydrase